MATILPASPHTIDVLPHGCGSSSRCVPSEKKLKTNGPVGGRSHRGMREYTESKARAILGGLKHTRVQLVPAGGAPLRRACALVAGIQDSPDPAGTTNATSAGRLRGEADMRGRTFVIEPPNSRVSSRYEPSRSKICGQVGSHSAHARQHGQHCLHLLLDGGQLCNLVFVLPVELLDLRRARGHRPPRCLRAVLTRGASQLARLLISRGRWLLNARPVPCVGCCVARDP